MTFGLRALSTRSNNPTYLHMAQSRKWILYDSLYKTQSNAITTEETQMAILKMSEMDTIRFFIWTTGWEKWQPLKGYLESNQDHFISSLAPEKDPLQNTVKARVRDVVEMKPADKEIEEEVTKSFSLSVSITKAFSSISLEEKDIVFNDEFSVHKFNGDDLDVDNISKPKMNFKDINQNGLKDRPNRHELKIEILLISTKGKTFRSRSKNISMSGSLLEDNIPFDYCGRIFDIVVINKQPCPPQFQRVSLKAVTVGEGLTRRIHYVNMIKKEKQDLQNLLENYIRIQDEMKKKKAG